MSLVHIPYRAHVHMTERAKLLLCERTRSYVLVSGHVAVDFLNGQKPQIFNKGTEFIDLLFDGAPGSLENRSHKCYAREPPVHYN